MLLATVLIAALCLAYANGANDNFKGVATLFGSGTTNYRGAILWATVCTLLGSIAAVMLARTLIAKFTGKGLVPVDLATEPVYGAAVALGAGLTVLLATRLGMPVSTTHGLVGALVGAGWAAEAAIDYGRLGNGFFAPLLVSPLLAVMVTVIVYPLFRVLRRRLNVSENSCVCVTDEMTPMTAASSDAAAIPVTSAPVVSLGTSEACQLETSDAVSGTTASGLLDQLHFLSAGVVSFARGLNDTPKIAALLLIIPALGGTGGPGPCGAVHCRRGSHQRTPRRRDDESSDHKHEPRPGLHGQRDHRGNRDWREPARPAGLNDPRQLRLPVRHRHGHRPSPLANDWDDPPRLGSDAADGSAPGRNDIRRTVAAPIDRATAMPLLAGSPSTRAAVTSANDTAVCRRRCGSPR